jgi:hypothetical protein
MYLFGTLLNRFLTNENIENATKRCKISSFLKFLVNIEKSQDLGQMLHFHRKYDFMQIIVKNMKFGMFCVTAYVYMGQDESKSNFHVVECKK